VKKKLLVLPLALLVAALGLAACGGGSSSSSGDEASIETAIEEAATSTDPAACTEFQTKAFIEVEDAEGGVAECEEIAKAGESVAESVDVSNVEIEGETATAEAAITGSALNGQTIEVEAAKEGGDWKLNAIVGLAKYDAEALGEGIEGRLSGAEGVSPELAACVGESVSELSQEEAEEFVVEDRQEVLEEAAQECE
jgi:ABC-type glycerol-3-phosphate transport system substrate-binding protein